MRTPARRWLLTLIGLAFLAVLIVLTRGSARHPVMLRLIGRTNDNAGGEVVYFSFSNRTSRPLVYLSDAPGLPYYFLTRKIGLDPAKTLILLTNYNQQQFFTARPATLAPGGSLTFPVPVPKEATGAVLRVNYMSQTGWLGELYRKIFLRVRGWSFEPYQNLELQHPFNEAASQER